MRYLIVIIAILMSACQSSPSKHFYLLTATQQQSSNINTHNTQLIGVGPIQVADYLNRLAIVTQADHNSATISPTDFWAEPLDKGIARIITSDLAQLNPNINYLHYPWRSDTNPAFSLRIQINNLDRNANTANIVATWELTSNTTKLTIAHGHFVHSTPTQSDSQSLAQAYSRLIELLAADINSVASSLRF